MNCLRRNFIPIIQNSRVNIRLLNDLPSLRVTGDRVLNKLNTGNCASFDNKIIQNSSNIRLRLGVSNFLGGRLNRCISKNDLRCGSLFSVQTLHHPSVGVRLYSAKTYSKDNKLASDEETKCLEDEKKLTLFQKFKQMYRDYWYVLIPVHFATSVFWFGGFYAAATVGVDVVSILEFLNVNENLIEPFRNGLGAKHAGLLAVAFALYKIATPLRYATTLGGTTYAINYLKKMGYIKPIPRKEKLKELYLVQKDNILEKIKEKHQITEMRKNVLQRLKETHNSKNPSEKP